MVPSKKTIPRILNQAIKNRSVRSLLACVSAVWLLQRAGSGLHSLQQGGGGRPQFDFLLAGFPGGDTTTWVKAFYDDHEETDMFLPTTLCAPLPEQQQADDSLVIQKMNEALASLDPRKKRGFRCNSAIYDLSFVEKHSPQAKLVVGVRHPVKMLESFYNYRVWEIYVRDDMAGDPIPTLFQVIKNGEPWRGVSLEAARFELYFMQLGETAVSSEHKMELFRHQSTILKPTFHKVFVYSVDQLEDTREERSSVFRRSMADFLGLKRTIEPFSPPNRNGVNGWDHFKESIHICDAEFQEIRNRLVLQGKVTAEWIRDQFLESNDVTVANKDHFIETLEQWGTDPCTEGDLFNKTNDDDGDDNVYLVNDASP